MGTLSRAVGWADYLLTWAWVLWFGIGIVVGGIMLACDEWRLHRTRPKPEAERAYAQERLTQHRHEAFRIRSSIAIGS